MARRSRVLRIVRSWTTLAALMIVIIFAGFILALPGPDLIVHEVAGAILLVLIGTSFGAAWRMRSQEPDPASRLAAALVSLFAVGATGGLLAAGVLPAALSFLPLTGLVVLSLLLADAIRVGRN